MEWMEGKDAGVTCMGRIWFIGLDWVVRVRGVVDDVWMDGYLDFGVWGKLMMGLCCVEDVYMQRLIDDEAGKT